MLQQIYLNDAGLDGAKIEEAEIGNQLVRFLSRENVNWIMDKTGGESKGFEAEIKHYTGFAYVDLALGAHSHLDFGYDMLVPNLEDKTLGMTSLDDYEVWDVAPVLIVFKGGTQAIAYNVPDAGNFLFGVAAHQRDISYLELKFASQLNEGFGDSGADQRAVARGFLYSERIRATHIEQYLLLHRFIAPDKEKPEWFRQNFDDSRYRRSRGNKNARDDD